MIRQHALKLLTSALMLFALSGTAQAGLLGTTMAGTLNPFYPLQGGNDWDGPLTGSASPTTAIVGAGVEYDYDYFGIYQHTADFTDTGLSISSTLTQALAVGALGFEMTFQSAEFIGATINTLSSSYTGLTASLIDDLLTLSWPSGAGGPYNYVAEYSFDFEDGSGGTPVPSPAPLALLGLGLVCLRMVKQRGA